MVKIGDRKPGRIRPDLRALRRVLDDLGRPQDEFAAVLVVGTNGKGSTAVMLEAILAEHGLATGLFTSPHLCDLGERIQIDAPRAIVERSLARIEDYPDLTYFEALTAAAFLAFREAGVDWAVLEAGMGGKWDATLMGEPEVVGLTNVGTDHQRWLGSSREDIAYDKGHALRNAPSAILGPGVDEEILPALAAPEARSASACLAAVRVGNSLEVDIGGHRHQLNPPLPGAHQIDNLTLALALAVEILDRPKGELMKRALGTVVWPGRLTSHRIGGRRVLMDCAHNREAAIALAADLGVRDQRYNLVFSCLDDKPVEAMAAVLRPVVGEVVVCPLSDQRAMPVERIARAFGGARIVDDPVAAVKQLDDPVLAAGSLRLVGTLLESCEGGQE